MPASYRYKIAFATSLAMALLACDSDTAAPLSQARLEHAAPAPRAALITEDLAPFGDGYPSPGDPCRRLGESPATSRYLDDSAILVGCPTGETAAAMDGEVVDVVHGITLVSIPTGDANTGLVESHSWPTSVNDGRDVLVPGTDYHATAQVRCGFGGAEPADRCSAGVKRRWGEDGTTLVEVVKPEGNKRAIFFQGITPYGADSAQADGSAGWDFDVSRRDGASVIRFGPETYVIPDALVIGG